MQQIAFMYAFTDVALMLGTMLEKLILKKLILKPGQSPGE